MNDTLNLIIVICLIAILWLVCLVCIFQEDFGIFLKMFFEFIKTDVLSPQYDWR